MSNSTRQRRVILDLAVTLDGFIEGKNGEVDWCIIDDEMEFSNFLDQIDAILYGRKSFDMWGQYVPAIDAPEAEQDLWQRVHSKKKYVFSRTQLSMDENVTYINKDIQAEVSKLKAMQGKDIWLYGGARLISTFVNLDLIDEFRLSVHPVILGEGKRLFVDVLNKLNLKLVESRTYSSGVVQLIYHLDS